MNDEPVIRFRPRKSKDGPSENPLKSAGILRSTLRLVQVSKRGQKGREERIRDYRNVAKLPLGNKPHNGMVRRRNYVAV
jgi:hypothetical protein